MAGWRIARDPEGRHLTPVPGMRMLLQTIASRTASNHIGTVQDISGDTVSVAIPEKALRDFWRIPGQAAVGYLNHAGKRYVFDTVVLDAADTPCPLVVLQSPSAVFLFDERAYFRLRKVIEPAAACLIDPQGHGERPVALTVLDLSGGGLQLAAPEPLPMGSVLQIDLPLAPEGVVRVRADVVSVQAPDAPGAPYRLHARFRDLREADEQKIIRFIFQEQVRLRQKGLS